MSRRSVVEINCRLLRNQCTLRGPHQPAAIAFDEGVSETSASVKRCTLIIFTSHVVYAGNNRDVSLDTRVKVRKLERIKHSLTGFHIRNLFRLDRKSVV